MKTEARVARVRDILYCEDECQADAAAKALQLWTGAQIEDLEHSSAVSGLKTEEVSLLNRLYGSGATCYVTGSKTIQRQLLRLMRTDLYRNFRRATYNKDIDVMIEDWMWTVDEQEFINELDIELTVLENVLTGFVIYLLGGFKVPSDPLRQQMNKWLKVDVSEIFNRPREIFVLTDVSPAVIVRFCYWKCTSVLMGLMRRFSDVDRSDVEKISNGVDGGGYYIEDGIRLKDW